MMLFPRTEWRLQDGQPFQGECGLTPGDRTRIPVAAGFRSVPCLGWQNHLTSLASKSALSYFGLAVVFRLSGSAESSWLSQLPRFLPFTPCATNFPVWLMSLFSCPVHLPSRPVRPAPGRSNCASWMGCFLSSCRSSEMCQDGGSHPGVVCLWRHFWLFQPGSGCSWQCTCGGQ